MARRRFWRKRRSEEAVLDVEVSRVQRARPVELDPFNPPDADPLLRLKAEPTVEAHLEAAAQIPDRVPADESAPVSRRPVDLEISEDVVLDRVQRKAEKKAQRSACRTVRQARRDSEGVVDSDPLLEVDLPLERSAEVEERTVEVESVDDRSTAFSEAAGIRRKANRRATRRKRLKLVAAAGLAVAMVAASVVGSIWWQGRDVEPVAAAPPLATSDTGESLLVALMEGDEAVGFALVTTHPDQDDRIVLVPPSLLVILPGYGRFELADAIEFGGPELAALAVTNLSGARIDHAIRASVTSFSKAVDGVSLELPNPVVVVEGDDQVVAAAAGVAVRDAAHLRIILGVAGVDDQLTLLVRQQLVWQALLATQGVDEATLAEALIGAQGDRSGALTVLSAVAKDELTRVTSVPVTAVDALGGTTERYKLGVGAAQEMIATQAPYLAIVDGERHRVEILNGTSIPGVAVPIAARLVKEGFRVVRTDNADHFGYLSTRVVGHTSDNQGAALDVGGILGVSEIHLEQRQPSGIVDVTIIVGEDMT